MNFGKALTNKIGSAMAKPATAYHESKSRGYKREYDAIKNYQTMRKSGAKGPHVEKARNVFDSIKSKRS